MPAPPRLGRIEYDSACRRDGDMDRLWAPWRAQYIRESSGKPEPRESSCFLCADLEAPPENDRSNLVVWRRAHSVVVLNRFPYNNGHLLVAPNVHRGSLTDLNGPELIEPIETIQKLIVILDRLFEPHGYNIGLNLGKAAGAGLPGHLHWHIVPRWNSDSNFMPVTGESRVIVESLESFYDRFVAELANDTEPSGSTTS